MLLLYYNHGQKQGTRDIRMDRKIRAFWIQTQWLSLVNTTQPQVSDSLLLLLLEDASPTSTQLPNVSVAVIRPHCVPNTAVTMGPTWIFPLRAPWLSLVCPALRLASSTHVLPHLHFLMNYPLKIFPFLFDSSLFSFSEFIFLQASLLTSPWKAHPNSQQPQSLCSECPWSSLLSLSSLITCWTLPVVSPTPHTQRRSKTNHVLPSL